MDNLSIKITAEGAKALAHAIAIIWSNAPGGKATHYAELRVREKTSYYTDKDGKPYRHHTEWVPAGPDEKGTPCLVLYWHESSNQLKLPFPLDADGAVSFIHSWLKNADYGGEPDHDGDNGRGFYMFTDYWGHVCGNHYAIVGIMPEWAMYGK